MEIMDKICGKTRAVRIWETKKKKNVIGEKCIKDGKDNLTFVVADRLKVWK